MEIQTENALECFDRTKLVSLRIKKGITRWELYLETGVEYKTLWNLEKGAVKRPSFEAVIRLATFFGVSPEEFVTTEFKRYLD